MAKKKSYEEKVIAEAADIIMKTICEASYRIANRYERKITDEVMCRIQMRREASDAVRGFSNNDLIKNLDNLAKE